MKEDIEMPKMKTHTGSKKRFKITATGKVKRPQAFSKHKKTEKSPKRRMNLRKSIITSSADEATVKKMIPYK